jgi:O-antigen/teichoic acid export membrane protein
LTRHAAIPVYFVVRVTSALILLKLSAQFLTVEDFANFAQLLAFASLLNMAVVGGAQNGLIRQAAAAADHSEVCDVHSAGLAIWLAAVPLVGISVTLFSEQISQVLTGTAAYAKVVVALAALSLAAGPGQVWWSLLSGRNRVTQSLGAQAFGILAGSGLAAFFIVHRQFAPAALAFAAGPLIAATVTLPFVARLGLKWIPTTRGLAHLLRYSVAIASTLGFSAIVLFALRSQYRSDFGPTQLGYWLAANRISDMSTQFLGLFMLQAFVPQLAATREGGRRSRLVIRYGLLGACLTGFALLTMLVAGTPLVHLFLSDKYLPALTSIRLYMLGDFFRVWVSLAMFTAFASGYPGRYAAIEIVTMTIMAALTLLLIARGELLAPQIGYVGAFGLMALVLAGRLLVWPVLRPRSRLQPRDARRIFAKGSAARAR